MYWKEILMRRKDRLVSEFNELIDIIKRCDVCRLGINDEEVPYILPLNFGMSVEDDKLYLYFHGATEGYKYSLIEKNNLVSFEMDCDHELYSDKERGYCTMNYSSVMGRGRVEIVDDVEEKIKALTILTDSYHEVHFEFNPAAVSRTTVMKLAVESMTGKQKG